MQVLEIYTNLKQSYKFFSLRIGNGNGKNQKDENLLKLLWFISFDFMLNVRAWSCSFFPRVAMHDTDSFSE